jgi:N-acetylglutamate synthase-like GNAT family acetyltransferase
MPDRRFVKANPHALPLMLDIVESTASLAGGSALHAQLIDELSSQAVSQASFGGTDFYLGFEEHFPFGFAGIESVDDAGRLYGPFVYRDYVGKGYGNYLFQEIVNVATDKGLRLVFALIPAEAVTARSFLSQRNFDLISADPDFIKRWRDGLLAEMELEPEVVLWARLTGSE